jgi:Nucleotidyl transferase AbiEii toxin, Type IV TA system
LVGGYALAAHGFSRFTEDIDILVSPTAENSRRWILALSHLPDAAAAELSAEGDVLADSKRYASVRKAAMGVRKRKRERRHVE